MLKSKTLVINKFDDTLLLKVVPFPFLILYPVMYSTVPECSFKHMHVVKLESVVLHHRVMHFGPQPTKQGMANKLLTL